MNTQDFCYWLKGFSELSGAQPTPEQWQSIKEHLDTVFVKVTPPVKATPPQLDADKLRDIFDRAAKEHQKTPIIWPHYDPRQPDYFLNPTWRTGPIC